ncbi:hypothetical protein BKA62DRAFT_657068 [Auriculariales sp. MPI-PUGE-AT-0066]|nr:hypothetical protein BKA62DRAFT_657068 [Auriculariales sp. MPI-PUGE-AT-0066]
MPALPSTGNESSNPNLSTRAWWDDVWDWLHGNGNNNGNGNGNSGNNGNNGGHTSSHVVPSSSTSTRHTTVTTKTTDPPVTHTSNTPAKPSTSLSVHTTNNDNGSHSSSTGGDKGTSSNANFAGDSDSTKASTPTTKDTLPAVTPSDAASGLPSETGLPSSTSSSLSLPTAQQQQTQDESSAQGKTVPIAAIVVPIILVLLAAASIFIFLWIRRRRRHPQSGMVSIHSNVPSVVTFVGSPSPVPASAGDISARSSMLLAPSRAGMTQADSRPVSMTSSALHITNPFASRTVDTPFTTDTFGSEAGHIPYGHSPLNTVGQHSPTASISGSIVGSAMFSTASAQHSHNGVSSAPSVEAAANPFGDHAHVSAVLESHMRVIHPSTEDVVSEDVHVGYGAALASSVGHGLQAQYHDDGRSLFSATDNRTPTSLFFRPSIDVARRDSVIVAGKAFPMPPQQSPIAGSPITPVPPAAFASSADDRSSPVPFWIRNGAPSPPPKGPLPALPSLSGTFGSSHEASSEADAYGGIVTDADSGVDVQVARRAPIQSPVFVQAPPSGTQRGYGTAVGSPLQRSPSVLTAGSDDDDYARR